MIWCPGRIGWENLEISIGFCEVDVDPVSRNRLFEVFYSFGAGAVPTPDILFVTRFVAWSVEPFKVPIDRNQTISDGCSLLILSYAVGSGNRVCKLVSPSEKLQSVCCGTLCPHSRNPCDA